ncbi:anthocyanidin 5,3-O-glucosyltransferase-like isoform X3 [Quercus robur]|uniref:anthocyanidin 5,3-O-glucosyltransferase-like isoform X3 n=1 Tax=Quercus robur TaxID=38942 RepID=UPI002161EC0C|nr:anthocyanidin 5,3-O-glucosyltransferase-like isoform X3 [Quercus robur]
MVDAIVLYPSSGRGHLNSMVELGKLILKHHPSFSITILILSEPNTNTNSTAPNYVASSTTQYITTVNSTTPSITFHHLPPISEVPPSTSSFVELSYLIPRFNNQNLHQILKTIYQTSKLKAFIIDFFCDAAFEVATNLDIPTYYFFTSGASFLAALLYRPTLHKKVDKSLKDLGNTLLDIPGLPPIQALDLPEPWKDRTSKEYQYSLNVAAHMAKSNGLLVNTFDLLETKAIKAISGGLCVPDRPTPPIFCIGPLISSSNQDVEDHECLNWLNSQPSRSVVFLCFGSLGLFSAKQLKEIAVGLENSGQRFLWVLRNPPPDNEKDPNLDELLPKGFLERTKEKGFVVKRWAPQVAVLRHESVGGFVTHCGWNSVLEAVWCGVPMIGWPLYAEQRLNRVVLVEEIKLALGLNESEDGLVSAAELEKRVKELMDSEVGTEVRERVSGLRDEAVTAVKEGGSSHVALAKLDELWRQN